MQQGTDLITQLAETRRRQGLPPMPNPHFIHGFGENDPPSPPAPAAVGSESWAEDDEDPPTAPTGATHYVAQRRPVANDIVSPSPGLSEEMVVPQFKLVVMDQMAQYLGHPAVLTEEDQNVIRQVVVKAIKRELDAAIAPEASGTGLNAPPSPKRGRGRPRKHPVAE